MGKRTWRDFFEEAGHVKPIGCGRNYCYDANGDGPLVFTDDALDIEIRTDDNSEEGCQEYEEFCGTYDLSRKKSNWNLMSEAKWNEPLTHTVRVITDGTQYIAIDMPPNAPRRRIVVLRVDDDTTASEIAQDFSAALDRFGLIALDDEDVVRWTEAYHAAAAYRPPERK